MQETRGRGVSSPLALALGLLPLGSGPRPPFLKPFPWLSLASSFKTKLKVSSSQKLSLIPWQEKSLILLGVPGPWTLPIILPGSHSVL